MRRLVDWLPYGGELVKTVIFCRFLAIIALGWSSLALGDAGTRTGDLSEYVFLHLTRSEGAPPPSAAREYMCRGKPRMLRT